MSHSRVQERYSRAASSISVVPIAHVTVQRNVVNREGFVGPSMMLLAKHDRDQSWLELPSDEPVLLQRQLTIPLQLAVGLLIRPC